MKSNKFLLIVAAVFSFSTAHGQSLLKPILLIIASQGYQPLEYAKTRTSLEESGFSIVVASDRAGMAIGAHDELFPSAQAWADLSVDAVNTSDYEGIFFIGGPLVLDHLDNQHSYRIAQEAVQQNIPLGAISYAPRILAQAGVLAGRYATGWNGDNYLPFFYNHLGVKYVPANVAPVVVAGNIITSEGRNTSCEFGYAAAEIVRMSAALRLKNHWETLSRLTKRVARKHDDLLVAAAEMQIPKTRISHGSYLYWPQAQEVMQPRAQRTARQSSIARPYAPRDYIYQQQPVRTQRHPQAAW